ncbi:hypothetical protein NDU88_005788 [Pleurodeles waltl]|uniref:Uncharacterized protein n=1 Tax=Pleurodeles waltl TaxID=8319 RepID=A0AAV7TD85_PLEWA|nr:hypothetical protein NDU88_005788 [Pleurodeles waltl]
MRRARQALHGADEYRMGPFLVRAVPGRILRSRKPHCPIWATGGGVSLVSPDTDWRLQVLLLLVHEVPAARETAEKAQHPQTMGAHIALYALQGCESLTPLDKHWCLQVLLLLRHGFPAVMETAEKSTAAPGPLFPEDKLGSWFL